MKPTILQPSFLAKKGVYERLAIARKKTPGPNKNTILAEINPSSKTFQSKNRVHFAENSHQSNRDFIHTFDTTKTSGKQFEIEVEKYLKNSSHCEKIFNDLWRLKKKIINEQESLLIARMIDAPETFNAIEASVILKNYCVLLKAEQNKKILALLIRPLDLAYAIALPAYQSLNDVEKESYIQAAFILKKWFNKDKENDLLVDHGTNQSILRNHEIAVIKMMDLVSENKSKLSAEYLKFYFEDKQVEVTSRNNTFLKNACLVSLLSFVTIGTWNDSAYIFLNDSFHSVFGIQLADSHWDGMEPFSAAVGSFIALLSSVKAFNVLSHIQFACGIGGRGTKYGNLTPFYKSVPNQKLVKMIHLYCESKKLD